MVRAPGRWWWGGAAAATAAGPGLALPPPPPPPHAAEVLRAVGGRVVWKRVWLLINEDWQNLDGREERTRQDRCMDRAGR